MTLKNDLLIDKRIVQRNIEQGKLDPVEYQKLLDALPDASDKVWRRTESSGTQAGAVVRKSPVQAPFAPRVQDAVQAGAGFDPSSFSPDEDDDDDDDDDDLDDADEGEDETDGDAASGDDDDDDEDDDGDEEEAQADAQADVEADSPD
jgi:hypothetical protein